MKTEDFCKILRRLAAGGSITIDRIRYERSQSTTSKEGQRLLVLKDGEIKVTEITGINNKKPIFYTKLGPIDIGPSILRVRKA